MRVGAQLGGVVMTEKVPKAEASDKESSGAWYWRDA